MLKLLMLQVAVYGIATGTSQMSPEFSRLRQQLLQRRCEEALDAAAAARVLQAHAAAAAADPGGATAASDRKAAGANDREDDERVRVRLLPARLCSHSLDQLRCKCTSGY